MARNRSVSPSVDLVSRQSASPPPQPQSKRERKKNILMDRFNEMTASFDTNMRPHYEAQVAAIQMDIQLILRADPYQNKPLDDDPEQISKLIHEAVRDQLPAVAEGDFAAGAGKMYSEFVHKVNDAMEERDIALSLVAAKYQNNMAELRSRHQFQLRLAQEEHRLLEHTIRERLVAQVSRRREKLLREKEQLDIGDSNALLLHPNQFSIGNPASPGTGAKRATRHTGKRAVVDPDDPSSMLVQESKRKRRTLFEEAEGQSPAPGPSRIDLGAASPFRDARAKNAFHQYEASAYSIDRLFTEKELSMAMNTAAIAATNFFVKSKAQGNGQNNGNGGSGGGVDGYDGIAVGSGPQMVTDGEVEDSGTPAGAEMERTVSQSYHATRGATRNLLNDLAMVATRDIPFGSATPMYVPAIMGTKANSAPVSASPATQAEVEQDLLVMQRDTGGDDAYNDKILERAAASLPPVEYQYRPPTFLADGQDGNPAGLPNILGGIPMSTQNSTGGQSEPGLGGAHLSRSGSALGGVGMKRAASATSFLGVTDTSRRVRARV